MHITPHGLALVCAVISFGFGFFKVPSNRFEFIAGGLMFWALALVL